MSVDLWNAMANQKWLRLPRIHKRLKTLEFLFRADSEFCKHVNPLIITNEV